MNLLLPVAYFPPISYFAYAMKYKVKIEAHENFLKQSIRNRCTISSANGTLQLVVPKAKSIEKQSISECQIFDDDWKTQHWRSLEAAYRNSPFFDFYADEVKSIYENEHSKIFDLSLDSTKLISELLNISLDFDISDEYISKPDFIDLRNAWNKKEYRNQPPVTQFPSYIQVFSDRHEFASDLSILDLLFCLGPQASNYLDKLELNIQR